MNLEIAAGILGLVATATGTYIGVSAHFRDRINSYAQAEADRRKKEYAAERDFAHLQRNYQQLQSSLDVLTSELERRLDRVEMRISRYEIQTKAVVQAVNPDLLKFMDTGSNG